MRYILVSVCDRTISAYEFESFEGARLHMMSMLHDEFVEDLGESDATEQFWEDLISNKTHEDASFAFSLSNAWANLNGRELDWSIFGM